MKWAHIARGLTPSDGRQFKDWVQPNITADELNIAQRIAGAVRETFLGGYGTDSEGMGTTGVKHALCFDGKRWLSGSFGNPADFLTEAAVEAMGPEWNRENLSRQSSKAASRLGRVCHWLHGFVSDSGEMPEQVPFLNGDAVSNLHEKTILDNIWSLPSDDGTGGISDALRQKHTFKTDFTTPDTLQDISDLLPEKAQAFLKKQSEKGKLTFISFDPETKAWQDLSQNKRFTETFEGQLYENRLRTGNKPGFLETFYDPGDELVPGKLTGKGKLAIAGVTVLAVAGTAAYLVHRRNKHQQQEANEIAEGNSVLASDFNNMNEKNVGISA